MFVSAELAQSIVRPNPGVATGVVFNGAQFFTALIAGVLLAFAFQLLLTNFGVAAWISTLGRSSSRSRDERDADSSGNTIRKVSVGLGLATTISVTVALFFACLLAIRLGLFISPVSGAIVGLTIWATFFTLLVWLSSTTIGSFVGSVVNSATSGLQTLVGTVTAAMGAKTANRQVVATAEAAAAAVSREIGNAIDPASWREQLDDYLQALRPPQLDVNKIAADFERLLDDENFHEIAASDNLGNIDRNTFSNLIADRTDLSQQDLNRIADKLESVWRKRVNKQPQAQTGGLSGLMDYFKSATRDRLLGKDFNSKLDTFIAEVRQNRTETDADRTGQTVQNQATSGLMMGLNSIVGVIMGRTDLSDFDIDRIVAQIQGLKDRLGEQTDKVASKVGMPPSRIRTDIETYLNNANPWQLSRENLEREFREVIYDPEADPKAVAEELQRIDRADFVQMLKPKGLYIHKERAIADILDKIRLDVLATVEAAIEQERTNILLTQVEDYLLYTPTEIFSPEHIRLNFKPILQDADVSYQQLSDRIARLDRAIFESIFARRQDLSVEESSVTIDELEAVKQRVLQEALEEQQSALLKIEAQWQTVQSYLQTADRNKLNPLGIQQELSSLLGDVDETEATLKIRRSHFDRNTIVHVLTQRHDLTEEQIDSIVDTVEKSWNSHHRAHKLVAQAKERYDLATATIADYLRSTGKEELNPEGIKRDLTTLLQDPKAGFQAISNRLAALDRDTLVQLLAQRNDLNEEQINHIVDEVQSNLQTIARMPRRFARRTQQRVQNFQQSVADYLRSTDKEELNPEGIQRDLQLLLRDPRAGMGSWQERLSHFDRDTLVSLLSQRQDISEADANRIVDQILVVREQMLQQLQTVQTKIQHAIDGVLAKIRDYLNSLERPELNYDSIASDLRTLFDDPKAGFEALRDRFSHFDRDTLIAFLSSRGDLPRAHIDRIVERIERTRDRVLQRAERIQQQAKLRLEEVKQQAKRQAEETRKAAAAASWWLFLTGLISAIASAGAGAIGVVG